MRDELHTVDGLIFRGDRIVIPGSLRPSIMDKIHEGHLGQEKCQARACSSVYWPGMTKELDARVARCAVCSKYQKSNQREPLMPHEIPPRPWAKVGADIFTYGGSDYVVIVDYFSKYPEVCRLEAKTAEAVIAHLKSTFARHGIPEILIADNMPFGARELREFGIDWGFDVCTSSPLYAQSNGQSERFVGTVKQLMRKAAAVGQDPHIALLQYHNTPVAGLRYSPAQLLMSRMLQDKVPIASDLLQPRVVHQAGQDLKERQEKQKRHFDRGTRERQPLVVGDTVRVQMGREWAPALVTERHVAPRSYIVTTETGHKYQRNSQVINRSKEPPPVIVPPAEVERPESVSNNTHSGSWIPNSHLTTLATTEHQQINMATPRHPTLARGEPAAPPSPPLFPPNPVHMPEATP